jgi:hypothetical protein
MKLILSRKGFDSSAGGVPSPVFPDGRMVSLPIPDKSSVIPYDAILYNGGSLGNLVEQLTCGRVPSQYRAHIDPDLAYDSLPRLPGWQPIFGQTGQAQTHLRNNGVGPGDLFLFFGLFRRVELVRGSYRWAPQARPRHVIWGWLQVAEVLAVDSVKLVDYQWAEYHPHFHRGADPNNVVYLARRHLEAGRLTNASLPGAGTFTGFSGIQQLTAVHADKTTTWELPGWFHPCEGRTPLTYHADAKRWQQCGHRTELQAVARGQEFVLDCAEYPEALDWACSLLDQQEPNR